MFIRHRMQGGVTAAAALIALLTIGGAVDVARPVGVALPDQCCSLLVPGPGHNVTSVMKRPGGGPVGPVDPPLLKPSLLPRDGLYGMQPRKEIVKPRRAVAQEGPAATPPLGQPYSAPPRTVAEAIAAPVQIVPAAEPLDPDVEPNTTSSEIDGPSARRAVAAAVLGAISTRSRPSRLLGDAAAGSLLASTADAYWGLGEQAALQLIVGGKPPEIRQLMNSAQQITFAAANQSVAQFIDEATQYGQDNGIRFLRNLEVGVEWYPGNRPSIDARTIDSLFESPSLDHTLFLQAAVHSDFADTTINAGLGYRYMLPDSQWMLGINAFYDQQFPIGHQRMSIGLEASTDDFMLFGNRYIALSDWIGKNAEYDERALSGWDAGIAGQLPWIDELSVSLAAFRWEREVHPDETGLRLTADYQFSPALQFGATVSADDTGDVEAGLRLSYQFGAEHFGGGARATGSQADRRLGFVKRENTIETEQREVPRDYVVSFVDGAVTAQNESSLTFTLSGAPRGSLYRYGIMSSAGGTPVTGEGIAESDPQPVFGVDVSGLADGTLTLTTSVTSPQGATGPAVTGQIVKNTVGLTLVTTAATTNPTNANPIPFTMLFSQAVTSFDVASLVAGNGTAANLRTADSVTWTVDVTPAGQGAVSLEVPAGAATSGAITNNAASSASVVYDSLAPAGYSVAFLSSAITAAAFEIRNGEAGSHFRYTISSSAGGAPVTGNGVIGSAAEQVSGLDLSGLADGTLTLSVILEDALGNAGSPATDTMQKGAAGPTIFAITPPSPGDYDDL